VSFASCGFPNRPALNGAGCCWLPKVFAVTALGPNRLADGGAVVAVCEGSPNTIDDEDVPFCDTLETGSLLPEKLDVSVFDALGLIANKLDGAVLVGVFEAPAADDVSLLPNTGKEDVDCPCPTGCVLPEAAPNSGLTCAAGWLEPKSPFDAPAGGGPAGVVEKLPKIDEDGLLVGVELPNVAFPNKLGV